MLKDIRDGKDGACYGYKLENGNLVIAEDEVEVIRVIYDRYIHTNAGVAGAAKAPLLPVWYFCNY